MRAEVHADYKAFVLVESKKRPRQSSKTATVSSLHCAHRVSLHHHILYSPSTVFGAFNSLDMRKAHRPLAADAQLLILVQQHAQLAASEINTSRDRFKTFLVPLYRSRDADMAACVCHDARRAARLMSTSLTSTGMRPCVPSFPPESASVSA
jgi:hypothetical protein